MTDPSVEMGYLRLAQFEMMLRAVCVGFCLFGAFLAYSAAINAMKQTPTAAQQQPVAAIAPAPSPASRQLSSAAAQINGWPEQSKAQWNNFCASTGNGSSYPVESQQICNALQELNQ